MQAVLIALAALVAFATTVWLVDRAVRSVFPSVSRNTLGMVLIAAAIWLLFFRLFPVSLALFVLAARMLSPGRTAASGPVPPRTSKVRTTHLEMTLDHESGDIDGRILCGAREGQMLSDLPMPELLLLLSDLRADDQSLKLLETYLDRAHPGWHDHAERSQDHGERTHANLSDMSREDAYRILGLEPGSTEHEIREAYRRLIKRLHPDSGGSAVLTAQITSARDRLLDGS